MPKSKVEKINELMYDVKGQPIKELNSLINDVDKFLQKHIAEQDKVKIKVEHPGVLEVPEGKKVNELPLSHFKKLIKKKGWSEISKALINLKVWNKNDDPELSKWADKTQEELSKWVEKKREEGEEL